MKHTPAPWFIENHKIRANGYSVADIHGSKTSEGLANAHLIAAAPDLLEALENHVKQWDVSAKKCGYVDTPNIMIMKLAIAKAKGE